MHDHVTRIWRAICAANAGRTSPNPLIRPKINDTLFLQMIAGASYSEPKLRSCIGNNAALISWANNLSDDELTYFIWLHRNKMVQ
jgi:hypothetical protein